MTGIGEYRYGNYVSFKGRVCKVNNVHGSSGLIHVIPLDGGEGISTRAYHKFEPVRITDVGSLKMFGAEFWGKTLNGGAAVAGFDLDNNTEIEIDLISGEVHLSYFDRSIPPGDGERDMACIPLPIKYIHQLQNFVFAYSGKELEVKE